MQLLSPSFAFYTLLPLLPLKDNETATIPKRPEAYFRTT